MRRKNNLAHVLFLVMSLVLVTFVISLFDNKAELQVTGYFVSSTGYNDSIYWDPRGASPKTNYQNNAIYDSIKDKYIFSYNDSSISLNYTVLKRKSALFENILVNASYNTQDYNLIPSKGAFRFWFNGEKYNPWDYGALTYALIEESFGDGKLYLSHKYSLGGEYVFVNATYWIEGKVLKIKLNASKGNIDYVDLYKPDDNIMNNAELIDYIPYATINLIRYNEIFFSIYNDWNLSKGSRLKKAFRDNNNKIRNGRLIEYYNNTFGLYQKLDEIIYYTVSEDISDLFINVPTTVAPYKEALANTTYVRFGGWCHNSEGECKEINDKVYDFYKYGFTDLLIRASPGDLTGNRVEENKRGINWTGLGYKFNTYSNYIDCYLTGENTSAYCNKSGYHQQQHNNSLIKGWLGKNGVQAYVLRYDRFIEVATMHEQEMVDYYEPDLYGGFVDVLGSHLGYIDRNGSITPGANSTYMFGVAHEREFLEFMRNILNGPVCTENGVPLYWTGYVDCQDASLEFGDSTNSSVIVDVDLLEIRPKEMMKSGFWRRYFYKADDKWDFNNITETEMDKYLATHIAFGHAARIDSPLEWQHNVTDQVVVRYYYLTKAIQSQYAETNVTNISYYSNSQWKSLSKAIIDGFDYNNSQIKIDYDNGLRVYVNRHSSNSLIVNYNNKDYTLIPNSWLAYNNNFFTFSGLQNSKRIDIVESYNYTYIDSRNGFETIDITPGDYKVESFDFINKRKKLISNSSYQEKVRTNQPLILTKTSVPQKRIYVGDLHAHTELSDDATGTVNDFLTFCRDTSNMDFCIISDHESSLDYDDWHVLMSNALSFLDESENGFIPIPGFEWTTTNYGHKLVSLPYENASFCTKTQGKNNTCATPEDLFRFAMNYSGEISTVINIAHPCKIYSGIDIYNIFEYHNETYERNIEFSSGSCESGPGSYQEALTNYNYRVGIIAGSDSHHLPAGGGPGPGKSNIVACLADSLTKANIFNALYNRNCYALPSSGDLLNLTFDVNGREIGSEFKSDQLPTINVYASKPLGLNNIGNIGIIKNNLTIAVNACNDYQCSLVYTDYDLSKNEEAYYYVKVISSSGETKMISSPIWVNYTNLAVTTTTILTTIIKPNLDDDNDGISNEDDNCLNEPNPSQLDADLDGYGNACDCDFDNNGNCGFNDYSSFMDCFGKSVPATDGPADDPTCLESNMDGDTSVGFGDFTLFLNLFGESPGPSCIDTGDCFVIQQTTTTTSQESSPGGGSGSTKKLNTTNTDNATNTTETTVIITETTIATTNETFTTTFVEEVKDRTRLKITIVITIIVLGLASYLYFKKESLLRIIRKIF